MLEFAGNPELLTRIQRAIDSGSLGHFYIINGPKGSGRTTLVRLMAAAMECTGEHAPCMSCNQCKKVMKDIHQDVTFVTDDRQTIGIDTIRKMRSEAYIRPNEGRRRIFIIPQGDRLTEAAQNATLKLLEEPPGTAAFFIITENSSLLLPTVRSRGLELEVSAVTRSQAEQWLIKHHPQYGSAAIASAAAACGGLIGKALELLKKEAPESSEKSDELLSAIKNRQLLAVAAALTGMERIKKNDFEPILARLLQGVLDMAAGGSLEYIPYADTIKKALGYCKANVSTAHICGFLSAGITELMENTPERKKGNGR